MLKRPDESEMRLSQLLLNSLERYAFGFRHHGFYPDQLQDHHSAEEHENVARFEGADDFWEQCRNECCENPMSKATERLSVRTMAVGKDLGDQYPNNRALADAMSGDVNKQPSRNVAK